MQIFGGRCLLIAWAGMTFTVSVRIMSYGDICVIYVYVLLVIAVIVYIYS